MPVPEDLSQAKVLLASTAKVASIENCILGLIFD